jgi:hypothetical protein
MGDCVGPELHADVQFVGWSVVLRCLEGSGFAGTGIFLHTDIVQSIDLGIAWLVFPLGGMGIGWFVEEWGKQKIAGS